MDFQRFEENNLELLLNGKKISGYSLNKFLLKGNVNKHTKLKMEIEISKESNSLYEEVTGTKDCKIEVYLNKKIDEKKTIRIPLFDGMIYKSKLQNYGNMGMRFSLKGKSKSIFLDREEKFRAFQDTEMTFREIVDIILKDYKDKKIKIFMNEKADEKIKDLIIQYYETDWEFLSRIASHLGMGLVVTKASEITFGFVDVYPTIKEEDMYFADYNKVLNGDYVEYEVYSSQVFNLGEIVHMKINNGENNFTIRKSKVEFKNSVFSGEYIFVANDAYKVNKKYNEKLQGSVIEARVEKVFDDEGIAVMHVIFEEGLKKLGNGYADYGRKRYIIPYATYYSQSNEGFFCTSETGDVVNVVFWNREEKHARVSWSTNNPGNGRFSDYTKRSFHVNWSDFKMTLDTNNYKIETSSQIGYEAPSVNLIGNDISSRAKGVLHIDSKDMLIVSTENTLNMHGGNVLLKGTRENVEIKTNETVKIDGKKVINS